jgi:hypothetical protein
MLAMLLVHSWVWVLGGVWFSIAICIGLLYLWIYCAAKEEVEKRKVHMFNCPTHGWIPEDALLYYEFPEEGKPTIRVPRCPSCMRNDMQGLAKAIEAKKVLLWKDKSA